MSEHYGIVGNGTAPRKVIHASLNDIGTKVMYSIPWYGVLPSEGLAHVYDWMLDNEAHYRIVAKVDGKKAVPKALASLCTEVVEVDDVDYAILADVKESFGLTALLWDNDNEEQSAGIAEMSIDLGLPTLELSNGLTPVILDGDTPPIVEVTNTEPDELENLDITNFDRETLEIMPAAHVKRLARNAGHEVKTKDDAIRVLVGDSGDHTVSNDIGTITISLSGGNVLTYNVTASLAKKIHELVLANV